MICSILKKGGTMDNPNNYRPITFASYIRKTLEKIIKARLSWWAENHKVIPTCQVAFRAGGSTQLNIIQLVMKPLIGFSSQQHTVAVFLDISAAYDNVIPDILYQKLASWGIPTKLINLVYNLLTDRYLYIRKESEEMGPRLCNIGLP